MKFYSKKDKLFSIICTLATAASLIPAVVTGIAGEKLYPAFLIAGLMLLILWWLSRTNYEITQDGRLIVRSAFLRYNIQISKIRSIEKTRNPVSAPALSLDRLQILYDGGGFGVVMVSPQNEERFIQLLREQNPKIVVK